jgi:DNA processing protein
VSVTWFGQPDFPAAFADDPHPPGVLFWRGDLGLLGRPCVAVVGTRRATPDGCRVAREIGRDLSAEGICVVSGLALGIDGAAHEGSVHATRSGTGTGPAGVAASGVDVPYPYRHARLWSDVSELGVMLSENPPGRRPEPWRFPTRNRIIAGLARLVVVVESHARGGSLITAEAAMERGIEVRVVPGPVHSPASVGSNQLLYDGPGPVRDAYDVLDAIGLFKDRPPLQAHGPRDRGRSGGVAAAPDHLDATSRAVMRLVPWAARPLGSIVAESNMPVAGVLAALGRLEERGLVEERSGWWSRRVPADVRPIRPGASSR